QAGQSPTVADQVRARGLTELGAHRLLTELCTKVGGRLSGSPQAAKAVEWAERTMKELGFENVRQVPCMVPHWVRGEAEKCGIVGGGKLAVCALGGSVATPKDGVTAEVVEVASAEEAAALGEKGKGKIVFINKGFDSALANPFAAYGRAVGTR